MIQCIKNVKVFRDGQWKPSDILISGSQIEQVADQIDCRYEKLIIIDGEEIGRASCRERV